jgi:hypothetical protein
MSGYAIHPDVFPDLDEILVFLTRVFPQNARPFQQL